MKITFACPYCGKKLAASATSAGKEKTCPNCRARVVVPTAEAAAKKADAGAAKPREVGRPSDCCSWDAGRSMKT